MTPPSEVQIRLPQVVRTLIDLLVLANWTAQTDIHDPRPTVAGPEQDMEIRAHGVGGHGLLVMLTAYPLLDRLTLGAFRVTKIRVGQGLRLPVVDSIALASGYVERHPRSVS